MNEHKQKKYLVHFFHPVCQEQCTSPKMSSFYLLCFALADLATLASTDADAKTWGAVTRWTISASCRRTHHWTEYGMSLANGMNQCDLRDRMLKKGTSWTTKQLCLRSTCKIDYWIVPLSRVAKHSPHPRCSFLCYKLRSILLNENLFLLFQNVLLSRIAKHSPHSRWNLNVSNLGRMMDRTLKTSWSPRTHVCLMLKFLDIWIF